MLTALIVPSCRPLLHVAAGCAVALIGFCTWLFVKDAAPSILLGIVYLCLWLAFYWHAVWRSPHVAAITPDSLAYPVLLVDEARIAEVCLSADKLTLRPENPDHIIEQRFHVVDAQGRRCRIENFRHVEKRPSTLRRVFNATVFNVNRFRVAFDLRVERSLTREEVLAQVNDRTAATFWATLKR